MVYELGSGRVYLTTHVPDAALPVELRVTVAAAATQTLESGGSPAPARPAALALRYQPPGGPLDAAGLAVNAAVAAALTAGAGASLVTGLLAPLAGAGTTLMPLAVLCAAARVLGRGWRGLCM